MHRAAQGIDPASVRTLPASRSRRLDELDEDAHTDGDDDIVLGTPPLN